MAGWWFYLDVLRAGLTEANVPDALFGYRLRLGALDGHIAIDQTHEFEPGNVVVDFVAADPFAVMPGGDSLLYGWFDGDRSHVRLFDVSSSQDTLLYETEDVIHFAALDDERATLYLAVLARESRRDQGVWRLALGQARAKAERFVPSAGGDPRAEGWFRKLWLADDGALLVIRDCQADDCRIQVVNTATSGLISSRRIPGQGLEVYGVTDDQLFFDANCKRPCPIASYSFAGGALGQIGNICNTATVIEWQSRPLLIYERTAPGCPGRRNRYEIVTHDLTSGADRPAFVSDGDRLGLVEQAPGNYGYIAPAGWFAIGENHSLVHGGAPVLVNAINGETVQLPEFGR